MTEMDESAKAAAEQAGEKRRKTAEDRKRGREQRAGDRAADWAATEGAREAWKGLDILAHPDGMGGRSGPDWDEAKKRAETWRKKSAGRPRMMKDRFSSEGRDKIKEYKSEISATGWDKARESREQAKSRLDEMRTNSTLQEAVGLEQSRLIEQTSKDKVASGKGPELDGADFARIQIAAENNVRAAMELQVMRHEKARESVEAQSNSKDPKFTEALNDALVQKQAEKKSPLTQQEKDEVRKQVINELTKETVEIMAENEKVREAEDKAFMKDPEFADKLKAKLALQGKTLQSASSEEARTAQAAAIKEMRAEKEQQEAKLKADKEKALHDRREDPEWKQSWQAAYDKLFIDAVIVEKTIDTPTLRQELESKADKQIELQHAEREAKQAQAKLEIVTAKKEALDARKKADESKASGSVDQAKDEDAALQAEASFKTVETKLKFVLTDLAGKISADPDNSVVGQQLKDTKDLMSVVDDMNKKLVTNLAEVETSQTAASEAKAKADLTVQSLKGMEQVDSDTFDAEALTKDLTATEVAAVKDALAQNSRLREGVMDTFIANRKAKAGGLTSQDSLTILMLKELFAVAKKVTQAEYMTVS